MLKSPYTMPEPNLFYEQTADNDFYLFLKREPYLLGVPHYHDSIEFACIERAETNVHIQGCKQNLTPGDICFINHYQVHNYEYYDRNLSAISLVLTKEYTTAFKKFCDGKTLPPFMLDKEKNRPAIEILNEWLDHGSQSYLLNCAYANRFFDALLKAYELQPKEASSFNKKSIAFLNYINENYAKPISLKTMAEEFGYSEGRCSYLFNKFAGVPFKSYLNDIRMKNALSMIASNNYSINEVIEQSGFGSPVTFYRQYAKYKEKMDSRTSEDQCQN